jgi:hypothetical protein
MERIFILSPAKTSGKRAAMAMNPNATFDLATRLRTEAGASIGEVFAFLSGLYFRGKLAYAMHFGRAPWGLEPCYVVTSNAGLVSADMPVTVSSLVDFGGVPIDEKEPRYIEPLRASARRICRKLSAEAEVVLLGSIATKKYVEPLLGSFGERLMYPSEFVGRGDMSRGGLLLRAVASNVELAYESLAAAGKLRGRRPPKLEPLPRRRSTQSEGPR